MNETPEPPPEPSPGSPLEGLDPRRLMAEGLGLPAPEDAPGSHGIETGGEVVPGGAVPEVPGYELLRPLGSGGMGRVFLARQISLDRLVAVKLLPAAEGLASQWLDRLEREAHAMARLSHPHVVAVYDFVRLGDGGAAIAMEWLESGNLRQRWLPRGRPLRDLRQAVALVRQIASGLAAAHGAGIVHRDLKPENVLVGVDGAVKVTDFGLALPLGEESRRFTLSGTSVGTLGYMAPEQLESASVDGRADLYALGVILYELLTGTRPQGHFDPPRVVRRDIPPGLEKVVLKALRTRPADRFATAGEFGAALDASLRPAWGARAAVLSGVVGLVAGGVALALAVWPQGRTGEADEEAFVERDFVVFAGAAPGQEAPPRGTTEPTAELPAISAPPVVEPALSLPEMPAAPLHSASVSPPQAATPAPASSPVSLARASAPGLPPGFSVPADWAPSLALRPLRGQWAAESQGGYRSDDGISLLQILSELPPEGADVRVAFTRLDGRHSVTVFFRRDGGIGAAEVSAWELDLAGIQNIEGKDLRHAVDPAVFLLENGRRYEMLVEIRRERVRLSVDGQLLDEADTGGRYLSVAFPWDWDSLEASSAALAIGSYESPTWFHEVVVKAVE